ncbi:hypothetical protein Hanom_Chr07g00621911 [Helianthus anomalus]
MKRRVEGLESTRESILLVCGWSELGFDRRGEDERRRRWRSKGRGGSRGEEMELWKVTPSLVLY